MTSLTDEVKGVAVRGYSPLSDAQKELANEGKVLEERCMRWLDDVHLSLSAAADPRSLALGRTHIQTGFMWAVRSIFKPSRIELPEDTKPQTSASESN